MVNLIKYCAELNLWNENLYFLLLINKMFSSLMRRQRELFIYDYTSSL